MSNFDRLINASDLIGWILECYPDWCVGDVRNIVNHIDEMPSVTPTRPTPSNTLGALDCVSREELTKRIEAYFDGLPIQVHYDMLALAQKLPSVQPEEVIPHRNYKYLSDYWCECGNHLGKKGEVKYCSDCGRKVKWDE